MHFSIPDIEECKGDRGSTYTIYNLHVNGVFHCAVRYSQLHDFQEQLKKEFGMSFFGAERFPPKKLLSLTEAQKIERRDKLEKYIQSVSQDPKIANSDIFKGFLLGAQKDTQRESSEDVSLTVFLMNGHKITVKIKSTDQTDDVLEAAAADIELPEHLVHYFALYLVKEGEDKHGSIVRRLQDFESPYMSLQAADGKNKLVLRKNYWDVSFDEDCVNNRVALQLLYVQAISDIERGWIQASKEQFRRLEDLKNKNSRKEYLQYVQTLKYYGYIQFNDCLVDYPDPNIKATVSTGNKELIFRIATEDGGEREGIFKITRMRCWKITMSSQKSKETEPAEDALLDLSFEYLLAKNKLQWISVTTSQAILLSLILQSMVEELLLRKRGGRIRKPSDRIRGPTRQFKGRDGGVITMTSSTTPTSDASPNPPGSPAHAENGGKSFNAVESVKKFTDKFHSAPSSTPGHVPSALMENDIFDGGIGEEDL